MNAFWPLRHATLQIVAWRGYDVAAKKDNVARTWSNEAGRKLKFLTYLNFEHVRNSGTFPQRKMPQQQRIANVTIA